MLDLLLRLLDNVKQLIELRNKRATTIFEKLIEPTFNDLQIVHQDYMETLGQLADLLPSDKDKSSVAHRKIKKALDFLEARSAKLEPVREKLRAYRHFQDVPQIAQVTDVHEFLSAVLFYLGWAVEAKISGSAYRTWILELHDQLAPEDAKGARLYRQRRGDLRKICIRQREEMRNHWSWLSRVYTGIKLHVVSR